MTRRGSEVKRLLLVPASADDLPYDEESLEPVVDAASVGGSGALRSAGDGRHELERAGGREFLLRRERPRDPTNQGAGSQLGRGAGGRGALLHGRGRDVHT